MLLCCSRNSDLCYEIGTLEFGCKLTSERVGHFSAIHTNNLLLTFFAVRGMCIKLGFQCQVAQNLLGKHNFKQIITICVQRDHNRSLTAACRVFHFEHGVYRTTTDVNKVDCIERPGYRIAIFELLFQPGFTSLNDEQVAAGDIAIVETGVFYLYDVLCLSLEVIVPRLVPKSH